MIASRRRFRITLSIVPAAVRDLVAAARVLRSRPGYLLVTSLTLAMGIAAATLVFTLIDAVAFASLPYGSPDRLAAVYEQSLEDPEIDRWPVAPATYADWLAMDGFRDLAAYSYASSILTLGESARRIRAVRVTGNAFRVLEVIPVRGRSIDEQDVARGEAVAVVSRGFWIRALGGDEDAPPLMQFRSCVSSSAPEALLRETGTCRRQTWPSSNRFAEVAGGACRLVPSLS